MLPSEFSNTVSCAAKPKFRIILEGIPGEKSLPLVHKDVQRATTPLGMHDNLGQKCVGFRGVNPIRCAFCKRYEQKTPHFFRFPTKFVGDQNFLSGALRAPWTWIFNIQSCCMPMAALIFSARCFCIPMIYE